MCVRLVALDVQRRGIKRIKTSIFDATLKGGFLRGILPLKRAGRRDEV